MSIRVSKRVPSGPLFRSALLRGASTAAVAATLAAAPAQAQLAGLKATLGVPNVGVNTPTPAGTVTAVTPTMSQILARHQSYQARVAQAAGLVAQANAAARAAAQAAAQTVRDGLGLGGLVPVSNGVPSAQDPTGLKVWQGASQPTQVQNGSAYDVTVNQTQSRALLSWNSFDIGRNTTLTFNQQGNANWVVVNRVVGGIDPTTGLLNPALAPKPSQILGSIKADGQVYVLNRAGVMFGATAQVNLHSLLASSLELGSATVPAAADGGVGVRSLSLRERNDAFLDNGVITANISGLVSAVAGDQHGAVSVAQGAQITANGGYVIIAAPTVSSAGEIKATIGGQVSLEAGTQVDAMVSTGAAGTPDPNVRGLILSSLGGGTVDVTGSIDAPQGYISLGTDLTGTVTVGGVLRSTTSVSRNGKISLIAGTVNLPPGAAISLTPDLGTETIPQSADSVAAFKTSQIDIGGHLYTSVQGRIAGANGVATTDLLPATITIGSNAIIEAPSANVSIGGRAGDATRLAGTIPGLSTARVEIQDNAVIDVSGVADYEVAAARNMLEISPAKQNELRDTPNYRSATTDGSFTLNGATLFVDPRISGVRADGVAWIGSPLIEAGSLASQIGVTAQELMTKGGNVTLATLGFATAPAPGASIPDIRIAPSAAIDFSGGWVRYAAGYVHYSKLVTADGRVIDISQADPNDDYVAVGNGFVERLPQLSDPTVYANSLLQGGTFQQSYIEGRDAGSLTIRTPTGDFNGQLHGDAVAGERQIGAGMAASAASSLPGDIRKLQSVNGELPSAGLLHIQSLLGGDMVVGGAATGLAPGTMRLDDARLNAAGLGAVSLQTSGKVTFAADSSLTLAPGGALNVDAGRAITFNGDISTPGGSITAHTYGILLGSLFDASDDLAQDGILTTSVAPTGMFDIVVNSGATLSTRGRWVNDLLVTDGLYGGKGYTSGGSISLTVAPHVVAFKSDGSGAVDLSGSILLNAGSLLDVSGGGYVSPTGVASLTGKGGNVSLINETSYFQQLQASSTSVGVATGTGLFRSDLTTFQLTRDLAHQPGVVPDAINAKVEINGEIRSFGFKGGGTFSLVTPDLKFGSSDGSGTVIPLDFFQRTGFGTVSLTAWNTAIVDNVFDNGLTGKTALLSTERVQIRAGETLDLTQSILPSILTTSQNELLLTEASGTDISQLAQFSPTKALGDYDNLPANLILGGLTELDLLGGTITGAPTASITVPKLYNAGTIRIAGGTVQQRQVLPSAYVASVSGRTAIGVEQQLDSDGVDRGAGLSVVFGAANAAGKFSETAANVAGYKAIDGSTLSNRDLVGLNGVDRQIYYLGLLGADQGIVLASGSVTDLSGASIRNPRAPLQPDGSGSIATGRMVDGGSIRTAGLFISPSSLNLFSAPGLSQVGYSNPTGLFQPKGAIPALKIIAAQGSTIDLSGAADTYDIRSGATTFTPTAVWSDGGTLSALGGGDITAATIDAAGGAPHATGGTLEWANPILVQASQAGGPSGVVSADQIEASGFASFIARGNVTTIGDVDLSLPWSFQLRPLDYSGAALTTAGSSQGDTKPYADPYYAISMAATGAFSITAPNIGLMGIDQAFDSISNGIAGTGSLELHGGAIDIAGAVAFQRSLATVLLDSASDIRLIGVQPLARTLTPDTATDDPSLSGQIIAGGDVTFRAGQVYATTGTGNLQRLIETSGTAVVRPFLIASAGDDATIRFEKNSGATPGIPYSAGSYVSVQAPHIEQAGVLRAPFGRLDLGSASPFTLTTNTGSTSFGATKTLTLEPGSLTSVSAGNLNIPYGTTTDLTEYFFAPGSNSPLKAPPAGELRLSGDAIDVAPGATVDGSGGGDIFAYEFVSGVGGSRDVLSRYNSDSFSSRNGLQYADGRQVYAILPVGSSSLSALYDPIYSSDYASLYGSEVGKTVHLDGAPGIPAGDYVLLPAHYALLPGGMRIVENVGTAAPLPGTSTSLRDGSIIVAGNYGTAGTNFADWQQRSFTVQSQDVFLKSSRIALTSGTTDFTKLADHDGTAVPRLAADAARIVINPLSTLAIGDRFDTDAAPGGRGSQVDIAGEVLDVVAPGATPRNGAVMLVTSDLDKLNAASLLIGGIRSDKADGSTDVRITAREINVRNDLANPLKAPEIVLAVDGVNSKLTVADGASIVATGTLKDTRSGDYNVAYYTRDGDTIIGDNSGAGSLLRVANGVERLVNRSGDLAASVTNQNVTLNIGQANISGDAFAIDTSRNLNFDAAATVDARYISIGGDNIAFSSRTTGITGLVITPELEQTLADADRLTFRATATIGFTPGEHFFKDLRLDAPGIGLIRPTGVSAAIPQTVTITAGNVMLGNSAADTGACRAAGVLACGSAGNSLILNATGLTFGAGTVHTYGFDKSVALSASGGAYYTGVGAFDVGATALTITTPFLVDRGNGTVPTAGGVQPDLEIRTSGSVAINGGGGTATPSGPAAPGSRLAIGSLSAPAQQIAIDGAMLRATAGTIELNSASNIAISGDAVLATPSYSQQFGDAADPVRVSASGGTISLTALTGDITLGSDAKLAIGGLTGSAGKLNLLASEGHITLDGAIDAAAPDKGASLTYDAGLSSFDLPGFVTQHGGEFTGDVAIRTGVGDLALNDGQSLKLGSLSLTADGGETVIGGLIDTSGANGGAVSLFGRDAVTLASTAVIDTHASGYAETDTRRASAGDVILGVGETGAIDVADGAKIKLDASRPGDRLVAEKRTDPRTLNQVTAYTYVEGDQGGKLTLRAPVISQAGADTVNVDFAGSVSGARDVTVEGYRRYDLATVAANNAFTGVTVDAGSSTATLDLGATAAGKVNFLADLASGTLVDFIQNFDISGARSHLGSLTSLAVYHERPGVELDYSGNIQLASNWNLGAGTVNVAAAVAAGDMRLSNLGPRADGSPRYEVVPGREADLFNRFVSMTYRVGGAVEGEAGVLTLRAGQNLNVAHSITDGFFAFGDQTDPDYISAQLGGGLRTFNPALTVQCGAGANPTDCGDVTAFSIDTVPPITAPSAQNAINFNLTSLVRGSEQLGSGVGPYSAAANAPAATGLFADGAGDPIGSAQLFPLLSNGKPVNSFSIQLVGGAGAAASSNPLHIDRASGGNVVVSGESHYQIAATKASGQYGGPLQLRYSVPGNGANGQFIDGDFLASLADVTGVDAATLKDKTARVVIGQVSSSAADFMRSSALAFFADYPGQVQFFGPAGAPTSFTAPVGLLLQFFASKDASGVALSDRFAAKVANGSFGYAKPAALGLINPPGSSAEVRTLVRTGTGSIDVAAAGDVDLRNGATPEIRNVNGQRVLPTAGNAAQTGGAAIYTAGHVVVPGAVTARVSGTQDSLTIDPSNYALTGDLRDPLWVPTSTGRLQTNPDYATGGGSITLTAGRDVLGRRDVWSEVFNSNNPTSFNAGGVDHFPSGANMVGTGDQRWRVGSIGVDDGGNPTLATNILVNPQLFSSGVGTLGGGDVTIVAGRNVSELTVALDTTATTGDVGSSFGQMIFGGGNLVLTAGHDILGGRFDISTGTADISAGRNIGSSGQLVLTPRLGLPAKELRVDNLPEIRITDTAVKLTAGGSIDIGKVSALGVDSSDGARGTIDHVVDQNALGYYTGTSGLTLRAGGNVDLAGVATDFWRLNQLGAGPFLGVVLPATLDVTSFAGNIGLGNLPAMLYPSSTGQLSLLAAGTLAPATIDLDDGDPSLMPGVFSALSKDFTDLSNPLLFSGRPFSLPVVLPTTTDPIRRLYHNANITHAEDIAAARIAVGGDLVNTTLFSAKQTRISAARDIVNMMFSGQNVGESDITRVVAGRDVTATTVGATSTFTGGAVNGRALVQGNQFIIGGSGAFYLEAGRDLGPFLNSATIDIFDTKSVPLKSLAIGNFPGGILSVGNDFNPSLAAKSADVYAFFGVAKGMDFDALRETYVNPANIAALDGDLFEQVTDPNGNKLPDRTKPIYAPVLIAWMQANQSDALRAAFGTTDVTVDQAYAAFAALPPLVQRKFLLDKIYFNELAAPSRPDGPSYQQYIRGYRAVDSLFPASLGYTANDLSGASNGGTRVSTGSLDLRLAAIETSYGSNITILGPGGDAILGSVVRTSAQAARRAYQPNLIEGFGSAADLRPTPDHGFTVPVLGIPIGYEGVLTLRGGSINGFTDGDFRLNQSRLFSQQSGDITLWSSNGNLNAGQGPKSSANVPPLVVLFDPNGASEVDSAGAVTGAGIAGFAAIRRLDSATGAFELTDVLNDSDVAEALAMLQGKPAGTSVQVNGKTYMRDAPTITLVAPVGTVDAGDAGVRAGGNIFVAAAQVANADNFKVGGSATGIPSANVASAPALPSNAASALAANALGANKAASAGDQPLRILVDVLGFYSGTSSSDCKNADGSTDPNCKTN